MFVAAGDSFDGPYRLLSRNLYPGIKIEDPDIHFLDGQYHMVVEDNTGGMTGYVRHGAHFVSDDGICWTAHDPIRAYTHTLSWDDGTTTEAERRERPELFNANAVHKGNGPPTHLLSGVKVGNCAWCHVQAIGSTD